MRILPIILTIIIAVSGCQTDNTQKSEAVEVQQAWKSRTVDVSLDSMSHGQTYLSVYSRIYERSESRTYSLTATVTLRNLNPEDRVYLKAINYHNTEGKTVRSYIDQPIYIEPMETLEVVIRESDDSGGTGGNFFFEWACDKQLKEPYFEAVMISTSGQLGISLTTQGISLN